MEGVGARLGRSSTRYGPATVFSGPVRKWKKRWVHVTPSSSSSNHNNTHSHHHNAISNGTSSAAANNSSSSNGNNGSHLLLFKWTPLSQSNGSSSSPVTDNNGNSSNSNDDDKNNANLSNGDAPQEPPRRKFKYIPVDLLEKQKKEAEEQEALEKIEDESKLTDTDPNAAELVSKSDSAEEKPDINDVPMEENEDDNQVVRQDLNESTLDLSLGLVS